MSESPHVNIPLNSRACVSISLRECRQTERVSTCRVGGYGAMQHFLGIGGAVTFTSGWEVLLGQSHVVNYLKSTRNKTVFMRYPGVCSAGFVGDRHVQIRRLIVCILIQYSMDTIEVTSGLKFETPALELWFPYLQAWYAVVSCGTIWCNLASLDLPMH